MKNAVRKLVQLLNKLRSEDGQDLIEYALIVALVAFSATASMHGLATKISSVYSNITADLTV